jgi:tRNA G10  N-methylase Trm11
MVIKSVYNSQDEILEAIKSLHCPEGFECDLTYGHGAFWNKVQKPPLCFDLEPQASEVQQADSTELPLADETLSNVVFDPPFLTYVRGGRGHGEGKMAMSKRYSGYWKYEELIEHYAATIIEAHRVLKPKGKMIFKCQDIIHNHSMHCTHWNVIWLAMGYGFRLKDLFILVANNRITDKRKQKHSRIYHSYFLVLEKIAVPKNKSSD